MVFSHYRCFGPAVLNAKLPAGPVKHLCPIKHTLRITGAVTRELELNLESLKAYSHTEVVAVLMCAGNRRATMETRTKRGVEGIKWGACWHLPPSAISPRM
jgi:DMSO/TMAO reductase YedYZ molybdopterin-dependent catalytic subunit